MRILYLHQYFKTPTEPGSTRSYWISRALIEAGHCVTMVTQDKNAQVNVREEDIDGIRVIYLKNRYSNSMSITERAWSFLRFMLMASLMALRQKEVDLVYATSTPLSIGVPALLTKWTKGVPFIFEVRDLWPEVPIQMGGLKNPLLKRLAVGFERAVYRNSSHVVALSPGMLDGVLKRISDRGKVSMVPNMAKTDAFFPRKPNVDVEKELGLRPDSFRVIYFGSMGIANNLEYVLEAARMLSISKPGAFEFLFLGEGATKNRCMEFCRVNELSDVRFYDRVGMRKVSEIVNVCDVSLVTFLDLPILKTNSPNKLFDSLAAGKPVVVNSDGWTKEIVERNGCGVFVDPKHPEKLAEALVSLASDRTNLKEIGKRARETAENLFDKDILTERIVDVVSSVESSMVMR